MIPDPGNVQIVQRSSRMLLGRSGRIALGFRYEYGLLSILLPAHWDQRVCPTMFRFKEAHRGIESEPIADRRRCALRVSR